MLKQLFFIMIKVGDEAIRNEIIYKRSKLHGYQKIYI